MRSEKTMETRAIVPFEELQELSALRRASGIKQWCQEQGILYILDGKGRPCTVRRALDDSVMRGKKTEPNWTAV